MHRQIIAAQPGQKVDHRNGNSLDNRRPNLRIATDQRNQRGFLTPRVGKTSRFRGVYLHKTHKGTVRWYASICVSKKNFFLGCYDAEELAADAYNEAAAALFGEFAQMNKV